MVAAKELGIPPWELETRSVLWRDRALMKISAEIDARSQRDAAEKQMQASKEHFG